MNTGDSAQPLSVKMPWLGAGMHAATETVLSGDPDTENAFGAPAKIVPVISTKSVGKDYTATVPPHSLTVLRIPPSA